MANRLADHAANVQQVAADTAAAVSVGSTAFAWVGTANEFAQLAASVVAIVAGSAAAWWHIDRIRAARKERSEKDSK